MHVRRNALHAFYGSHPHRDYMCKACTTKHAHSKPATELTVFMHYVGILVGVTMPTHDVLLRHFGKMLLYA